MPLKFTIIDYTTNPAGDSTVVNEPVGWDSTTLRLKRDKTWHGFFDFFDDSYGNMQWHGIAAGILKNAYQASGVQANCRLLVQYACADTDTYLELYTGKFVFAGYAAECGDFCYVQCGVENADCLMKFKSRYNNKVNLDSLTPIDDCPCNDTAEATGGFSSADNTILVTTIPGGPAALTCVKPGNTITIAGSVANSGSFTVVSVTLTGISATITVAETLTDEPLSTFTISGCLFQATLPAYHALNMPINLPPKLLSFEGRCSLDLPYTIDMERDFNGVSVEVGIPNHSAAISITPFKLNLNLDEITDMHSTEVHVVRADELAPPADLQAVLSFNGSNTIQCVQNLKVDAHVSGVFSDNYNCERIVAVRVQIFKGESYVDPDAYIMAEGVYDYYAAVLEDHSAPFSFTVSNLDVSLANGENLYFIMKMDSQRRFGSHGGIGNPTAVVTAQIDAGSYINIKAASQCQPTPAKVYMVNETLSRIAESYTGGCLRVKSDYFGRKDSQPYPSAEDGCGAMQCLTSGLKIRAKTTGVRLGDQLVDPAVTISMKHVFDGLSAIHNIGMGIEYDTILNNGAHWIRVEPVEHFYNTDILMECNAAATVRAQFDPQVVYNSFKTGYSKWETENVNGLNDIFAAREYNTSLYQVSNSLEKQSAFIASDLAIEVTRRRFGYTSKDWKYDNDTFIICLATGCITFLTKFSADGTVVLYGAYPGMFQTGDLVDFPDSTSNDGTYMVTGVTEGGANTVENSGFGSAGYVITLQLDGAHLNETNYNTVCHISRPFKVVEQNNISASANVLYPEAFYNLRITPARNAIRHLKTMFNGYSNPATAALYFSAGQGNYLAQLNLNNDDCVTENGMLAENQLLSSATLTNPAYASPFYKPELVTFEYPVTWQQYLNIKENPYGLIGYQCGDGPMQYGWIEDFQLKPYTGMGQFTLRPKID